MFVLNNIKLFCALAIALMSATSAADGFDSEYDEKPWAEMEVRLPAYPEKENLIQFRVGAIDDTQFLVDSHSLSVGADGVIRFTMVVNSSSGAQSISYEGMRCATTERRFYAFGRPDKTWSKARSNQWVKIHGGSNNHHVELFTNFFCVVGAAAIVNAEDVVRVLRNDGNARK